MAIDPGPQLQHRRLIEKIAVLLFLAIPAGCSPSFEYAPPPRSLEWIERYGYVEAEIIDFAFGDQGLWVPIVEARINDQPVRLILDTGTNDFAALDEKAFGALDIPVDSWSTFLDAAGEPAGRLPRGRASTLEVGPIRLEDVEVGALGPERITGKRLGYVGTLGWHSLGGRLTIDYSNRKVAIATGALPERLETCVTRHVANFVSPPEIDGLVLIAAMLETRRFLVQVDTGKNRTMLAPEIESIRSFEKGDRGIEIEGLRVGPFELQTHFGRMGRGFGSFERGVASPVLAGLGSDVLSRFLVTVDYVTRTVILEERPC